MELKGFGSSPLGNPYTREANTFCNILVNEVSQADTWASISDAIAAITRVRTRARDLASEWDHINNPSPSAQQPQQ